YRDTSELMAVFTRPATHSELVPADFSFIAEDVAVLVTLLRRAIQSKACGVNVLLYGPPGTGKTELARVVAQAAGVNLFEVEYADRDGNSLSGRDRYRSLQIGQVFLKGAQQAALLFDEVEDVFPPISVDAASLMARHEQAPSAPVSQSVNGKAWVNQILESNPVPTIWVTNRIEQIDPAFRRRFAYHLELKSPPPGAREQLLRKSLEGVAVSEAFVARLAERKGLTPAQIRTAVRFAGLAHEDGRAVDRVPAFEALIERQLKNADAALGNRLAGAKGRRAVTTYDLGMLNVETRFEIPRIIEALKARGHGTLCFYGAPGTGKTALGEHIAHALARPLIVKQASDLMSKYVGETEQAMAAMFREAESEKAVLLLDEADSFLQDRRGAQRTYEVTEVNEMLQGMERFAGIFICTTNLFDRIDQAALRRFTFKIQFKSLTALQREAMFVTEALGGDASCLSTQARARLAKLEQLCPGDFAAVKRQTDILATVFSADEFLDQLEAEHRIKPEVREGRGMGFLQ
ncbi:MAG: AAA family ATPase, partial [Burkholderiaceae bacterium]|nr:AAA family ATPase [Burkholderiaceae bacterium]